ncbi:Aldo/keto reductase family protein [compost metagenome]
MRANHDAKKREEQLRLVAEIAANEVPQGLNMAQWALGWCLQHPAVTSVIPGCKDVNQVISNAQAADLDMVTGA